LGNKRVRRSVDRNFRLVPARKLLIPGEQCGGEEKRGGSQPPGTSDQEKLLREKDKHYERGGLLFRVFGKEVLAKKDKYAAPSMKKFPGEGATM